MQVLEPVAVFAIALGICLLLRYLLLRALARRDGPRTIPRLVHQTIRFPSVLWCVAAALRISLDFVQLSEKHARWAGEWIGAFVIVSLTLVAASATVRMISAYGERQGMPFAAAGLSRALIRVGVMSIGVMMLLGNFSIAITPLLTALGVGGIAVALALQDTLANLFAGIHILVERPIFVSDHIRLENGLEGVVTDIGWRTTRVRTAGNDMVVVPNVKITSSVLVNYSLPEHRAIAEVPIMVAHDADGEAICRIAAEEAARVPAVLPEPAPVCLCEPGVLATHLQFKLIFHVASRLDQAAVQSEVRLRVLRRFRDEGVPLPDAGLVRANAHRG